MSESTAIDRAVAETEAPTDRPVEAIDLRDEGPPTPLTRTLDRLDALDDDVVLVQRNDRVPRHLFPPLSELGYDHDTVETEREVLTAIWASG